MKPREIWSDEELRTLRRMLREGATHATIAAELGRTRGAVRRQAQRSGLAGPPWDTWTFGPGALGSETEEGARMTTPRSKGGRPRLPPGEKRAYLVTVRVTLAEREAYEAAARELGTSLPAEARRAWEHMARLARRGGE